MENEEQHTIKDNTGESFLVQFRRSEEQWDFDLLQDARLIGSAHCLLHSSENLFLGNIEVFSTASPPTATMPDAKPQSAAPNNYRGRGLGASFLNLIICQARDHRFKRITGHLLPQNLQDKPDLPDWYRRRKFDVRMNADGRGGTISFVL